MNTNFDWPPPFTLRHSTRAKTVSLRISPQRGLQIVVPRGFNPNQAEQVLQRHKNWIEKNWRHIQSEATSEPEGPPQQLTLLAIQETWSIQYRLHPDNCTRLMIQDNKQLIVQSKATAARKLKIVLTQWLHEQARTHLFPWLNNLSAQHEFEYSQARIGSATTRWGSCSAKKKIALNYKLLFLPPALVEYVMLHELCHTTHLNHSRHFWGLLKIVNPNCHDLRRQLKHANSFIPQWLEN